MSFVTAMLIPLPKSNSTTGSWRYDIGAGKMCKCVLVQNNADPRLEGKAEDYTLPNGGVLDLQSQKGNPQGCSSNNSWEDNLLPPIVYRQSFEHGDIGWYRLHSVDTMIVAVCKRGEEFTLYNSG